MGEDEGTHQARGITVGRKWFLKSLRLEFLSPRSKPDFVATEGQPRGLIYMGWERGGGNGCDENQKEERTEMQRNYSNQGVAEKIKYQVVTSLYENYFLAGSLSLFLTYFIQI